MSHLYKLPEEILNLFGEYMPQNNARKLKSVALPHKKFYPSLPHKIVRKLNPERIHMLEKKFERDTEWVNYTRLLLGIRRPRHTSKWERSFANFNHDSRLVLGIPL